MPQPDPALPIIDWDYTKLLSGKSAGLTDELLQMFMRLLPTTLSAINEAFAEKDTTELHEQLHKLQGSCTYCGMARLADFVAKLARAVKQQTELEANWLVTLNEEIELVKTELKKGTAC